MRGALLFLEAAKRHGVRMAFGIVGGEAQAIGFDEVDGLDFILTRHEFAAGVMADVYARITGQPQICYSTFGPGVTNLATGVCSAVLDRSPMLAVSAQVPRREIRYNQTHQCIDNAAVMAPMTKFSREVGAAEEIPEVIASAMCAAKAAVPGPSFVSIPLDVMLEQVDDAEAWRLLDAMPSSDPPPPPDPDPRQVAEVARALAAAQRPMVLAGNAVIREGACAELRALVERCNLPVVTSLASKGVLPESHPLHIGPCNKYLDGLLRRPVLDDIFGACDLMLLVGYDFGEDVKPGQWMRNERVRTMSLTATPNPMGDVFRADYEVVGRLATSLAGLTEMLSRGREQAESDRAMIQRLRADKATALRPGQSEVAIPRLVQSVRDALGPDGILCSDIGLHKQYAGLFTSTEQPNTFLCSNGCGTFGLGLPAAMAAKLAAPERKVAVICGDGGFHSTSQDLETAARLGLPIVIVLIKDGAFGLIKYYQLLDREEITPRSVEFGHVDFAMLARANGCKGVVARTHGELEAAMTAGFDAAVPTLIEVPVTYQYRFDAPTV